MSKRVPETCAKCRHATKKGEVDDIYDPIVDGWACVEASMRPIPCRRGALPVLPKWCPRRGGKP